MPSAARSETLPANLPPRGLSRVEAARYVGISPTLFDRMIAERRMPGPKRLGGRTVWDRHQLDAAFAALPDDGADRDDPWSQLAV